jgi:hypothetical protein
MKNIIKDRRQSFWPRFDGLTLKDRRKAYFHGKYQKRVLSLLILVSFIGTYCLK